MSEALQLPESPFLFELEHLSPVIGTVVHGIDLRMTPDPEVASWLYDLLVDRKVIFFRDQDITQAQHIAFARCFGELEVHPFTRNSESHPEIIHLDNDRERPPRINIWHSDVTWREAPSLGSILRAIEVPEVGGDTLFANMEAAYERLDDGVKTAFEGKRAVHDNEVFLSGMYSRGEPQAKIDELRKNFPPTTHPVFRTHPDSGKKAIYVNSTFTRALEGMAIEAADALLQPLYRAAWSPDIQCRFRWQKNSIAFWDNRSTQHYAAADYWPRVRRMERVTVLGDRPY